MHLARGVVVGALAALLVAPLGATAAQADAGSVLSPVTITSVSVVPKNDGSRGNRVGASWTAPVTSDESSPLWYEVNLSTSATDPSPGGALTSIGSITATQATDLFDHFAASGTYFLWVTAHFDFLNRLTSTAHVAVEYARPVLHQTDSWTPDDFSLHVAGRSALVFRWRNYSNMPDVTIELAGPGGTVSTPLRMKGTVVTGTHVFTGLKDGDYRARVRQAGVASEAISADGSDVLDHVYEWGAWTGTVKIGAPGRVDRPRLTVRVPGRFIGNVDYVVALKRPKSGAGYTPTFYEIQRRSGDGAKRWSVDDTIGWKWSRRAAVVARSRGYRIQETYQVRVRACTSGDYRVYDTRMPVKVCGPYSAWSRTAHLRAARDTRTS